MPLNAYMLVKCDEKAEIMLKTVLSTHSKYVNDWMGVQGVYDIVVEVHGDTLDQMKKIRNMIGSVRGVAEVEPLMFSDYREAFGKFYMKGKKNAN